MSFTTVVQGRELDSSSLRPSAETPRDGSSGRRSAEACSEAHSGSCRHNMRGAYCVTVPKCGWGQELMV